ncbi:DUF6303 family protein [Streptomyces sp. NPDC004327]|uniref:DUF6303 family protein n=1 Tax=Streptomyces sp. NPDC004327 TaxID=3364699 RepID=UPI0036B55600
MHSARLACTRIFGWELYVVDGSADAKDWPAHDFARQAPIPTLAERTEALAALGYEAAGSEWEWQELRNEPTDEVELLASLDVLPLAGGGAS